MRIAVPMPMMEPVGALGDQPATTPTDSGRGRAARGNGGGADDGADARDDRPRANERIVHLKIAVAVRSQTRTIAEPVKRRTRKAPKRVPPAVIRARVPSTESPNMTRARPMALPDPALWQTNGDGNCRTVPANRDHSA